MKRWRVRGSIVVPTSGGGRSLTSLFALALYFSPLRDYDSLRKEDVFENNRLVRCQLGGSDLRFVNPQLTSPVETRPASFLLVSASFYAANELTVNPVSSLAALTLS